MRMLIVSGFLGAGKTTVLMELLHKLVDNSEGDAVTKVAVIENEVGDVSIDDKMLGSTGMSVSNLFSGCVCCTLSGALLPTLKEIQDQMDPEWVVLETTGVAVPKDIASQVDNYLGSRCKILIIVDASRWKRLRIPLERVLGGQLEGADLVFINKCDLVEDKAELEEVEADVLTFEPHARLFRTDKDTPLGDEIVEELFA